MSQVTADLFCVDTVPHKVTKSPLCCSYHLCSKFITGLTSMMNTLFCFQCHFRTNGQEWLLICLTGPVLLLTLRDSQRDFQLNYVYKDKSPG